MSKTEWTISGDDPTPDGYHDHMLYVGSSAWQAFLAVRSGLANGMTVTIMRRRR